MKQTIHSILGILTAFCLMVILLFTSVEAVCYWTPGYFEKEYSKYQVLDRLPEMTMEDLLTVTDEMMDYLKGNREDLHVWTTMGGEYREFFTEREIAHMEDVQGLFLISIQIRRFCLLFIGLALIIIFLTKGDLLKVLPKTIFTGTLLFFGIAALLGIIISTDFSKYFIVFHHIFFNNDLWILDPSVDMLINIVPEGFFSDTAARIIITYGISAVLVLLISFSLMIRQKRKTEKEDSSSALRFIPLLVLASVLISGLSASEVRAEAVWPESVDIQADGGILIDANSQTILFEKNADFPYYPASITKILTALIIIENCDMNDIVTFSDNAVNNVESNSSNMGALPGDQLTVRDCLYGLMLASANEAANALAEHCAGSIENFVDMMNQKAANLGCTGSHFANPSGLNNENHYVTARDMAIITRAAISNPAFVEIDGARYWTHAPIKRYPDPEDPYNTIYSHHNMLKKNNSRYYPGAFAGKTGYTTLAGNTLVTCAKRDNMTLICVILNGHQTHYQDTKTLFDFGFRNFKTLHVSDYDHSYTSIENDLTISGLTASSISSLSLDENCYITIPQTADFNDISTSIHYELNSSAPYGSLAEIFYTYGNRNIGSAYLMLKNNRNSLAQMESEAADFSGDKTIEIPEPTTKALDSLPEELENANSRRAEAAAEASSSTEESDAENLEDLPSGFPFQITSSTWAALGLSVLIVSVITATVLIKIHRRHQEEKQRYIFREKRKKRLLDIGLTQSDFDLVVEKRKKRRR